MKTWGSGGIAPPFLTSALDGGEWSASRPCCFIPGERAPSTHSIGGWVGPRVGLHTVEKRNILHCQESNLGHLACCYTDQAVPTPHTAPTLYKFETNIVLLENDSSYNNLHETTWVPLRSTASILNFFLYSIYSEHKVKLCMTVRYI
jgi:hypothetical protein